MNELSEKFLYLSAKLAFGPKARADMYEDLAAFISAGLPPFEAVEAIFEVHKLRRNPLEFMTHEWIRGMQSGKSFAQVIQRWVDPAEAALINSGERGGSLEKALREAASLTRARFEMLSHAKNKLITPLIQIIALFLIVFYITSMVVPAAKKLLPEEYMPSFAKGYFSFGGFFVTFGPWIALGFLALLVLIFGTMGIWTGNIRRRFDNFFPWIFFRRMQSAFFLITVSSLMRSGMPMSYVLKEMKNFAQPWLSEHIQRMIAKMEQGKREAVALNTGLLPKDMSDRLLIYSRLPEITTVMENLGKDAIINLRQAIDSLTGKINMAVMLIVAMFILSTIFALGEISFAISDAVESRSRGF